MGEFICKTAKPMDWQKWLNQWKHDYDIKVLKMTPADHFITMLVWREKK